MGWPKIRWDHEWPEDHKQFAAKFASELAGTIGIMAVPFTWLFGEPPVVAFLLGVPTWSVEAVA